MSTIRWVVPISASLLVGGCGLYVPEIQENPFSPGDGQLMVQAIVQSVRCEMIDALKDVWKADHDNAKKYKQRPVSIFLLQWGAQMTLTLTLDEKSSVAPTVNWMPPSPASAVFALGAGVGAAADATRTDKLSFYYLIPTLLSQPYCTRGIQQGNENSLLVRSDLKLEEWLADYIGTIGTQEGQAPTLNTGALKDTVLSHDIKFDITTTGNATPSWKLTRVTYDPTGTFFSTSRDRTHDLIITMGPGDKTGFTGSAAPTADAALQIGNAVAQSLKGNVILP
jgi:hypothetical protein